MGSSVITAYGEKHEVQNDTIELALLGLMLELDESGATREDAAARKLFHALGHWYVVFPSVFIGDLASLVRTPRRRRRASMLFARALHRLDSYGSSVPRDVLRRLTAQCGDGSPWIIVQPILVERLRGALAEVGRILRVC